jgi:cobalt-zinc-cadmium efflux system outer membrane protein
MNRIGPLLITLLTLSGCAHLARDGGFSDIKKLANQHISADLGWRRDSKSAKQIDKAIAALTTGEIDADRAARIALLANPTLQATYENLGLAEADVAQAGLLSNPKFMGAFRFPEAGGKTEIDLSLMQNFIDLVTLPARQRLAARQAEVVKNEVAEAVVKLAAETKAAFYNLVAARQLAQKESKIVEAKEAAYAWKKALRKAGNITELALARSEADLREAELARDLARLSARQAEEKLALDMGLGNDRAKGLSFTADFPPLPSQNFDPESLGRAQATRLDLIAARLQLESLAADLQIKLDWRLINHFELGVEHQRGNDGSTSTGPAFAIALPVFDQGQAHISKAEARLRQQARAYDALALKAQSDLTLALDRLNLALNKARAYETTLLPLQARMVDLTQKNYNYMAMSPGDLLEALQDQQQAEISYTNALNDYWQARTALEAAVGGDLVPPKAGDK